MTAGVVDKFHNGEWTTALQNIIKTSRFEILRRIFRRRQRQSLLIWV